MDPQTMTAVDWIVVLILGGIAGALGQVARVVVGLKKRADEAAAQASANPPGTAAAGPNAFDASKLVISIAIGFTAGALAALATRGANADHISAEQVLAFAAAGYAGADFIEGVMQRSVPK